MKALLMIFAIVVLAIGVLYYFTDLSSFDPAAQAAQIQDNVRLGMTWEQVADVREPVRFSPLSSETFNGRRQAQKFNRTSFGSFVKDRQFPEGFVFAYNFSDAHAVEVFFDEQGTVVDVVRPMTAGDLIQGKAFHGGN